MAAALLEEPEAEDLVDVEAPAEGVVVEALGRSWTFIDDAEPGMRLTSAGALRNVEDAAGSAPSAGFEGCFAAMLNWR